MRTKQYHWITTFVLFCVCFLACKPSVEEIIPPNFIIIFADDLGYGDLSSFGHSGFTGTITWADPKNEIVYVFLSNRSFPNDQNWLIIKQNEA